MSASSERPLKTKKPKVYRKSLNANQAHILLMVYKFRFVSVSLLARYKHKNLTVITRSLALLKERGYLGKRYSSEYRIQGKPAAYYLTKEGIAYLRKSQDLSETRLHAYYKNRSLTDETISRHLQIMAAYITIRDAYPDLFHIFTKADLAGLSGLGDIEPELYLRRQADSRKHRTYFLDVQAGEQMYLVNKWLKEIVAAIEDGQLTDDDNPALLFVLDDARAEKTFIRRAAKLLEDQGIDDLPILTTSLKALTNEPYEKVVWSDVMNPDKPVSLA